MHRHLLCWLVALACMASCHTPAWIQFKNKTKETVGMRYGYEGDSIMDVVIPPKSRVLLVYDERENWRDAQLKSFFEKDIRLEFYNEKDTIVYYDKRSIYDMFLKGRNHNQKGITIKIR